MGFVQVPADGVGKRVDTFSLTDALVEVHRQKIVLTGGSGTAEVVVVTNAAPAAGDMALVVRQAGTANVAVTSGTFNLSGTAIVAGAVNISAMPAITGTVNISGTALCAITGTVNISGTAVVSGAVNISAMPAVTGLVGLTAGTSVIGDLNAISRTVQVAIGTPFTVNNISATVVVSGLVGLTAGTAVIGDLNAISRTVQVAIGTPFILQGISTTVQVAIGTPFTVNNISAAVVLAAGAANIGSINNISANVNVVIQAGANNIGTINNISAGVVLAAGVANIGTINAISAAVVLAAGANNIGTINNISRTVEVAISTPFTINAISATVVAAIRQMYVNTAPPSASRGPKTIIASTSANVTLIAAPGAGMAVYITALNCSNAGATGSRARVGTSASIGQVTMFMASAGGGFIMNFTPPWEASANEAVLCSVKPNTSEGIFNVHFFVASADAL